MRTYGSVVAAISAFMFCANVRGRSLAYARNPSERARSALPSGVFSHTSPGTPSRRQRAQALPEQVALAVRDHEGGEGRHASTSR